MWWKGKIWSLCLVNSFISSAGFFLCSAFSSATAGSLDLLAKCSLQEQHVLRQSLCLYSVCLFGFVLINPVIGFQRQWREKNNSKTKLLKRRQCRHSTECDFGGLCSCFISLEDFNQPVGIFKTVWSRSARRENNVMLSLSHIIQFYFLRFMWFLHIELPY